MKSFFLFIGLLTSITGLVGCRSIFYQQIEEMSTPERESYIQSQETGDLCRMYTYPLLKPNTEHQVLNTLKNRGVAVCYRTDMERIRVLPDEGKGTILFAVTENIILPKNTFLANRLKPYCNYNECNSESRRNLKIADALFTQGQWLSLATWAVTSLPENNLSYYYLGLVAQNLGDAQKAIYYYEIALNKAISTCKPLSNECNGIDVPSVTSEKVASLRTTNGTEHFEKLKNSISASEINQFLTSFPKSYHAEDARKRIEFLLQNRAEEWMTASSSNDILKISEFITNNPQSAFQNQAKEQLAYLSLLNSDNLHEHLDFIKIYNSSKFVEEIRKRAEKQSNNRISTLSALGKCDEALRLNDEVTGILGKINNFNRDECYLEAAIAVAERSRNLNPLLVLGIYFESEGKNPLALKAYSVLIEKFPSHEHAVKAGERLVSLRNKIDSERARERDRIRAANEAERQAKRNAENARQHAIQQKNICLSARQACINSCPTMKGVASYSCIAKCGSCN